MAKRLSSTEKWDKSWFRKLKPKYKCFWEFLRDKCDLIGLWDIDFEAATFHVGEKISDDVFDVFKDKIIKHNDKILILGFCHFQYGETLNLKSPIHKKVYESLKKQKLLNRVYNTLCDRVDDRAEVKEEVEVVVKDNIINTESFKKQIETEHVWQENFYRKTKFKQGALKNLLDEFDPHLVLHPPDHPERYDLKEYKTHFLNWINKQLAKGLLKNYSKNLRQKGDL